jgi:hypothetical protein
MWHRYGEDGVAVCSRYDLLKGALDLLADRVFLGRVEYGYRHLAASKHENLLRLITTKREEYAHEREVRAFLWIPDEHAGVNRHYDEHNIAHPRPLTPPPDRVPQFQRRKVDMQSLATGVVVNPWATTSFISEVEELIRENGRSIEVRPSDLAKHRHLLP